jgi:RimJ/RimL family protein N-acetyltransferase
VLTDPDLCKQAELKYQAMPLAHIHHTERLKLRPVIAPDEAAVVAAVGDIAVSGWLVVVPHPYSVMDFQHFNQKIAKPGETFVIENAAGLAGMIALEDGVLGYWIAPWAQGHGFATEASRCLLAAYFEGGGQVVTSGYFEGNVRSAGVLLKLGFTETGRDQKFCLAKQFTRPHVIVQLSRKAFSDLHQLN